MPGRPPLPGGSYCLDISLSRSELARARRAAKRVGLTLSAWCRQAVEGYRGEGAEDERMVRASAVLSVETLPAIRDRAGDAGVSLSRWARLAILAWLARNEGRRMTNHEEWLGDVLTAAVASYLSSRFRERVSSGAASALFDELERELERRGQQVESTCKACGSKLVGLLQMRDHVAACSRGSDSED